MLAARCRIGPIAPEAGSSYGTDVTDDTDPWAGEWATLGHRFGGRRIVVVVETLSAAAATVEALGRAGAEDVFVVATAGAGAAPPDDLPDDRRLVLGRTGPGLLGTRRAAQAALADPPEALVTALARFDPAGRAEVVGLGTSEVPRLAGRRFVAWRRPAWVACDDKTTADALWDRAGVPRVPSEVVAADPAALLAASRRLDRGAGVVWAADSTTGWHGGAAGVRHVTGAASAAAATEELASLARRVRVMPFLEGIPCSIHGVVHDHGVLGLRPVEMLVFQDGAGSFRYTGYATFWDPPDDDRRQLRDIAAAVGRRLAVEVGFRGPFTVDGVLTAQGFRPTELNPRAGAGLGALTHGLAFPMALLLELVASGEPTDWLAPDLEERWVAHADAHRALRSTLLIDAPVEPVTAAGHVRDRDGVRPVAVGEAAELVLTVGTGALGSFAQSTHGPALAAGPSPAATVAELWNRFGRLLGVDGGPLRAATDRRA